MICALLSSYFACAGNSLPAFRTNLTNTSSDIRFLRITVKLAIFCNSPIFSKVPLLTIQPLRTIKTLITNSISQPVLFADDTSVMIIGRNLKHFCSFSNLLRSYVIKRFSSDNLIVNSGKWWPNSTLIKKCVSVKDVSIIFPSLVHAAKLNSLR